ncbi:Nitrogen fixation protein VnfA [compost metagenome]
MGLVEAADGGTLFLDEIGEMDLVLQAKLLKLLEDRSIRRIGAVKERKVDLRVISATNCNLEQMVQQGKFRRDLFFRLRIIALKVPRLYARGQDVLLLARHFLAHHGRRYGKPNLRFSAEAENLMLGYSWPGNVRELRNMLEQTVLLAPNEVVQAHQLNLCMTLIDEPLVQQAAPAVFEMPRHEPEPGTSLPDMERDLVCKTLDRTDWNVTKSARMLGLSRDMLRYRIEKLGLTRPDKRQW